MVNIWENLESGLFAPEFVKNTFLVGLLAQLQTNIYETGNRNTRQVQIQGKSVLGKGVICPWICWKYPFWGLLALYFSQIFSDRYETLGKEVLIETKVRFKSVRRNWDIYP